MLDGSHRPRRYTPSLTQKFYGYGFIIRNMCIRLTVVKTWESCIK